MSQTPAGWYQDHSDPSQIRYWDGSEWTEHTAPAATATESKGSPATPRQDALATKKVGFFGARSAAEGALQEVDRLRSELSRVGALDVVDLQRERDTLRDEIARERAAFFDERNHLLGQVANLRREVAVTEETAMLQEVGIYEYRHPLDDSVAYKDEISRVQAQYKALVKRPGGAVSAAQSWQVNGSATEGKKMISDFSKLMLRAYNADIDTLVRGLKPYRLAAAVDRLDKTVATIAKLGRTMSIAITPEYHRLRVRELELTADYQEMLAQEREREREAKERLREEARVQQEIDRELASLERQRVKYADAIVQLRARGDDAAVLDIEQKMAEVARAIEDADLRAKNTRLGHVYVISNVGSLGPNVVKIGMTRRMEPMDRVKELGDASVPFIFDVHTLVLAEDAVALEGALHKRFAHRRVNRVNLRKEFFYATPAEVREALVELQGDIVHYDDTAEALEFFQSEAIRTNEQGAAA